MTTTPYIRRSRPEESPALFKVFYSAVHLVASADYTPEQIEAWAPKEMDATLWEQHILGLNPFVAELDGEVVGYADLQPNGYMDHFFVSGHHSKRADAMFRSVIRGSVGQPQFSAGRAAPILLYPGKSMRIH